MHSSHSVPFYTNFAGCNTPDRTEFVSPYIAPHKSNPASTYIPPTNHSVQWSERSNMLFGCVPGTQTPMQHTPISQLWLTPNYFQHNYHQIPIIPPSSQLRTPYVTSGNPPFHYPEAQIRSASGLQSHPSLAWHPVPSSEQVEDEEVPKPLENSVYFSRTSSLKSLAGASLPPRVECAKSPINRVPSKTLQFTASPGISPRSHPPVPSAPSVRAENASLPRAKITLSDTLCSNKMNSEPMEPSRLPSRSGSDENLPSISTLILSIFPAKQDNVSELSWKGSTNHGIATAQYKESDFEHQDLGYSSQRVAQSLPLQRIQTLGFSAVQPLSLDTVEYKACPNYVIRASLPPVVQPMGPSEDVSGDLQTQYKFVNKKEASSTLTKSFTSTRIHPITSQSETSSNAQNLKSQRTYFSRASSSNNVKNPPSKLKNRGWLDQNRLYQKRLHACGFRVLEGTNGTKVCSFCNKHFSKEMFVWRHALHHIGEKPFYCSVCDQRFTRSDTLQRHIRRSGHQESLSESE